MLNVDLSTLRGQELRQLLDSTRRRGDAAVSYEILQEMAARRERGEPEPTRRLFGAKRPSEPRVIELNLGDPLDPKDPELEQGGELQEMAAPHLQAIPDWELEEAEEPQDATYLHPPQHDEYEDDPPPARPRRRWPWLGVGLTLGLLVGLGVGGWAESVSRQPATPPVQVAAATPPTAAQPAVDPIAVETETAPATAANASDAISPATAPAPVAAMPPPPATEVAEAATPAPPPVADTARPAVKAAPAKEVAVKELAANDDAAPAATPKAASPCAGQPTPADKIICQTPSLQHLQKELRQAYADALDAHQDRDLLREHQLAWREARNTVTEPDRLARLYEERIRKLNAAAAEARAAR